MNAANHSPLDRRLHAFRDDLADISLKDRISAQRFVDGHDYHVTADIAPLYPRPSFDTEMDTQVLAGHAVRVFELSKDWAWCQLAGDGYVGYVPTDMLVRGAPREATHTVIAPEAFAYAAPNARAQPICRALFGTYIAALSDAGDFIELAGGGFIGKRHCETVSAIEPDYVETMQLFLNAPYLWGGKSIRGIDCSGLVQLALTRAGIACPRDTDMQESVLSGDMAADDAILKMLQRGDIVYWPRHVATMIDRHHAIHANGTAMSVSIDPINEIASRSRGEGPIVAAVKRLMPSAGSAAQ